MNTSTTNADEEAFRTAIFSHDFNIAETYLSKVNIEKQDYNGYTYLLQACVRDDVQVLEWLVQHGANITAQDRSARNAIFIAIETVSIDIIKWLADDKRLLHTTYRGQNPLHEAILVNRLEMVKLLVAAGLDPDDQTPFRSNAFDLAQAQDNKTILEWLLTRKFFNILDEPHDEKTKVATLEILFNKYGYQFLNVKSAEKNLTIGDYAADMHLIEVLKWWKSKSFLMDETSSRTTKAFARKFDEAVFNHNFDIALKLLSKVNIETRDNYGNTYLMKACANNDIEAFNWLMQSGANIDVQHKSGRNLIFTAIDNNSLNIVKCLANEKKLLSTSYKGQNPLHEAVSLNGLDMVKLLVAAGVNPYLRNQRGDSAFDVAHEQTDDEILKWLLINTSFEILEEPQYEEEKIIALEKLFAPYGYQHLNVHSTEKNSTIAEYAAQKQQIEILLWLKSKDIPVTESLLNDIEAFRNALFNDDLNVASELLSKVNIDTRYFKGNTCLMEACVKNNVKVFEWLVQHGADCNVQDKSGKNLIFIAINSKSVGIVEWLTDKPILHSTCNGRNPLHEAISVNQLDMVKILVDAGLDPDVRTESKANAFDMAIEKSDKAILEWLLTNRSFKIMHAAQSEETKVAKLENLFNKYGYEYLNLRSVERNLTIAEYAAKVHEMEVLKWLKSKNISIDEILLFATVSVTNEDIFDKALVSHRYDIASKLLYKINIETRDYNGNTYLMKACVNNDVEVFEWLVRNGANINVQNKSGKNPIFIAIEFHSLDIIKWLVDDKQLLTTTYKGQNVLHAAVLGIQLDVVKLLIAAGIDPYLQNSRRACAFDLAQEQNDETVLEWLLTNTSFEILEGKERGEVKVASLANLFDKYGCQYLNIRSVERSSTIAESAKKMREIQVLKWLKSKNIAVDETLICVTDKKAFEEALFSHNFNVALNLLPKIDIETLDYNGDTYLMKACVTNDAEVFKWLIQHNANINVQDKFGRNSLFTAIHSKSLDIVKWLIDNKRFLNTFYKGRGPLHDAVLSNQLCMVKLLVAAKLDPETLTQCKINAFDLAQNQNDKAVLEWLLTNRSFNILDNAQAEEVKVAMLRNLFEKYGCQHLNLWFAERNLTLAQHAAHMRYVQVLKWLKSKNIAVDETLLSDAPVVQAQVVDAFRDLFGKYRDNWFPPKTISVDAALFTPNVPRTDMEAFEAALFNHNFDVALKLLPKINIEKQDYNGNTYLMKACVKNDAEIFDRLIQYGAKIDVVDKFGKNLLFMAIEAQSVDIVKRLVDDKRLLSTTNKGQTALHEAVLLNQLDMVKLLVAAGLDPNVAGRSKANAFDMADMQADKSILKWLLISRSFQILDEDQPETSKIAMLEKLFAKYGYQYLNATFAEKNLTIAEYAGNTEQVEVLKWLKSKNIQMPTTVLRDVTSTEEDPINILLLGETGVGKSTFINATANYVTFRSLNQAVKAEVVYAPIASHFVITDAYFQPYAIQYGHDENETITPGVSSTQAAKSYLFNYDNVKIQFIDTPGIGDARGIGKDEENFKKVLDFIGDLNNIHGICIMLKPNNSRLNILFEYCMKGLLPRLRKNARQNVVFVFTNSRGSFYKPGDTIVPLQEVLAKIKSQPPHISIPLNKNNIFCLDNEGFGFLLAKRSPLLIQFNVEQINQVSDSWTISREACKRLLTYIKSFKPHQTQGTVSLNQLHRCISKFGAVLGETTRYIEMNIRRYKRYINELSDPFKSINELREFLTVPTIDLNVMRLSYPATVCTNRRCVKIIMIEGIAQKNYTQLCHSPCYLKGVPKNVIGDPVLSKCCAMEDKDGRKTCKKYFCRHHLREHMHIDHITQIQEQEVARKSDTSNICRVDIEKTLKEFTKILKQYEDEMDFIVQTMAEFTHFLKCSAIASYDDTYKKYMESLINSEQEMINTDTKDLIKRYKQLLSRYEEFNSYMDVYLTRSLEFQEIGMLSGKDMSCLMDELYKLPRSGKTIKDLHASML